MGMCLKMRILYNRKKLLTVMENFQDPFNLLKMAIEDENQKDLTGMLVEATSRRIALEQANSKLKTKKDENE